MFERLGRLSAKPEKDPANERVAHWGLGGEKPSAAFNKPSRPLVSELMAERVFPSDEVRQEAHIVLMKRFAELQQDASLHDAEKKAALEQVLEVFLSSKS